MNTKETIQFALTVSDRVVMGAIDKAADQATTFPTPNGGCHPLWVLGHLTIVEGMIPAVLLLVVVLVLGIVWHGQTSPPAFQNQKLMIPESLKSNPAAEDAPTSKAAATPSG